MYSTRWGAALVVLATGCSETDNGVADPTSYSLTARDVVTLRSMDGTEHELPVDLDPAVVQAYARDGEGAWAAYAGQGTSDGELGVGAVPDGAAWLRVDYFDPSPEASPHNELFFVDATADTALDLGTWRTGRAGVRYPQDATQVTLAMSGLAPWQPGLDLAVVYTPNVDFVQVFSQDYPDVITGLPTDGATSSTLNVDWVNGIAGPVIDPARADHSFAMQFRFRLMDGVYVGAPIKAAEVPQLAVANGETSSADLVFTDAAELPVRVAVDRDAFDANRSAIAATVSPSIGRGFAVSATTSAVRVDFSPASTPAELVVVDSDLTGTGMFDLGTIVVHSPFPADHVYGTFISAYNVPITRDDGLAGNAYAEIGVLTDEIPAEGAPAKPLIGPAANVTVSSGLTPMITWDAPTLGIATEYEVTILAAGGADVRYDFLYYPSAIFHVPGDRTSLELPPEVLTPDLPYIVTVRAISNALDAAHRAYQPRRVALPYGWADSFSTPFKP